MKVRTILLGLGMLTAFGCTAELKPIMLEKPNVKGGMTVMEAFKNRHSERDFSDKKLSGQDLSNLLWAANGVNRENGGRTAASCMGKKDVDLYVFTADGAYLYMPDENMLKPLAEGDNRALVRGGQTNMPLAPVWVLIVSDWKRLGIADEAGARTAGAEDGGIVSGNISLFCAGTGLATVPRGTMDQEGLRKLLNLPEDTFFVLNHPVGYAKQ